MQTHLKTRCNPAALPKLMNSLCLGISAWTERFESQMLELRSS